MKRNVLFSVGISKNERKIFSACKNSLFNREAHSMVFKKEVADVWSGSELDIHDKRNVLLPPVYL